MSNLQGNPHVESIANGSHKFGSGLLLDVSKPDKNAVFSSFSISSVISMASLGARGNTLSQIRDALQLPNDRESLKLTYSEINAAMKSDDNITLEIANSIFPSNKLQLKDEFLEEAKKHFGSEVRSLNYRDPENARKDINQWVERKTNSKIKELFASGAIDSDTVNVLVNAIYFKGDWLAKFNKDNTMDSSFHVSPEKTIKVPMMFASDIKFRSKENEDLQCTIVELPYKGERMSMYFLVPDEKFGLAALEKKLSSDVFTPSVLDDLYPASKNPIYVPKFKLESYHDLGESCKKLGLSDMFDDKSDFSGMAGGPGELYVSKVVQKAVIEVNEEGSEAAAASGMAMMMRCAMIPNPPIRIDHPFAFMIKDNSTGLILFSGRVVDPSMS
eukprot:TRINITY_DN4506_c0_g1_i1.p1 TRINITY_DN4506_c0_g1~~TRINITY_DN4506_c0_g1_i1.p1  ORF type:complete len:387 (+),score=90.69 TRINITY_DN4506_c0_g1_i1:161-1321(+)